VAASRTARRAAENQPSTQMHETLVTLHADVFADTHMADQFPESVTFPDVNLDGRWPDRASIAGRIGLLSRGQCRTPGLPTSRSLSAWAHQQDRGYDTWVMRDPRSNEFCVLQPEFPDLLGRRRPWSGPYEASRPTADPNVQRAPLARLRQRAVEPATRGHRQGAYERASI
jgi:hypothetical protein